MKEYYTAQVSKSLLDKLIEKKCPYACKIDMGFTVPQLIDRVPIYAEVLDWFIENGLNISINSCFTFALADHQAFYWEIRIIDENGCEIKEIMNDYASFKLCIEDAIVHALKYI